MLFVFFVPSYAGHFLRAAYITAQLTVKTHNKHTYGSAWFALNTSFSQCLKRNYVLEQARAKRRQAIGVQITAQAHTGSDWDHACPHFYAAQVSCKKKE
jgi:hypothetical protein